VVGLVRRGTNTTAPTVGRNDKCQNEIQKVNRAPTVDRRTSKRKVKRSLTKCAKTADVSSEVVVLPNEALDDEMREYYRTEATEERDKRDFLQFREQQSTITNVSSRDRSIDFRIGERDVWPDYLNDDHLNAIGRSSISTWQSGVTSRHEHLFVTEIKIHLPPARETLRGEIDDSLSLPDGFGVHYGTGALGGMPAPDGVITPHIVDTEDVTFEATKQVVEESIEVYENAYDHGRKAIKEQP